MSWESWFFFATTLAASAIALWANRRWRQALSSWQDTLQMLDALRSEFLRYLRAPDN